MQNGLAMTVEARPAPIEIDIAQTAVIVVDMQNGFGAKGGMFDRAGYQRRNTVSSYASQVTAARRLWDLAFSITPVNRSA